MLRASILLLLLLTLSSGVTLSCGRPPVQRASASTGPDVSSATAAEVHEAIVLDRPRAPELKAPRAFTIPVAGGVLPTTPELLPGSARPYRGGFHEGIDFPAKVGTPVRAAAAGRVSRVDYAYQEWAEPARNAALDNSRRLGYTPELVLDLIRGRQVWIDHGDDVVTRYAHLSTVAPLARGDAVDARTIIGEVGSSGYPEGGPHLHFEIRYGDSYLGAGTDVAGVREAVAKAFGP